MKFSQLIIIGLLLCFYGQAYSQAETSTEAASYIRPFGVGLHLEQFKMHDIGYGAENLASNKLVLTFNPSHSLRIEPEFGFNSDKEPAGNEQTKHRNFNMGLGVFGMVQRARLNIYGGPRFEYSIQKEKHIYSNTSVSTVNIFTLGPAVGCEYFLSDQVALGGEFAVKFASTSQGFKVDGKEADYTNFQDIKYAWTDTGLFLRFYF